MKGKLSFIILIPIIAGFIVGCVKHKGNDKIARVKMLIGAAQVDRNGTVTPLSVNETFGVGDIIRTGPDSALVASIGDGDTDLIVLWEAKWP